MKPGTPTPTVEKMELRDYFAAQALAIIAAIPVHEQGDAASLATEAYAIADAMLAAREGGAA